MEVDGEIVFVILDDSENEDSFVRVLGLCNEASFPRGFSDILHVSHKGGHARGQPHLL